MPIEPPEVPPATPGHPTEPPQENPPGNPQPEIPVPVREPGDRKKSDDRAIVRKAVHSAACHRSDAVQHFVWDAEAGGLL